VLFVLSGPSGVGKSTLGNRLLAAHPNVALSVSHTTRPPRGEEVDGVHYHFVDAETFQSMVDRGEFAEHAGVFKKRYGTANATIESLTAEGRDVLFDIDYQGAQQLSVTYPDAVTVLLAPPSMAELESRLRGRKTDTEEQIQTRLGKARLELSQYRSFRYVVVNDSLDAAGSRLNAIYEAESARVSRNLAFLTSLLGDDEAGNR